MQNEKRKVVKSQKFEEVLLSAMQKTFVKS
jgi:hypothetical protein